MITTIIDAHPVQCLRLGGPSVLPMLAAAFTGGVFILSTFHLWWAALASGVLAASIILVWLWSGTARIPEKPGKDVGLGLTLPLYMSGGQSVGWWAMFITMMGDMTAFVSLVFGYFFYWTSRPQFLAVTEGPGTFWPVVSLALAAAAWGLTMHGRRANGRDRAAAFQVSLGLGALAAAGAAAAMLAGPYLTGMDPEVHVYPAIVWLLAIWTAGHLLLGLIMQLYCMTRRAAGRLSARHDIDIANVTLYWHFLAVTVATTAAVIAFAPALLS
jgi:cytochrome c oxidase subunit I+III